MSQRNDSDDAVEKILKELESMPMGLSARDRRVVRAVLAGNLKMATIARKEGISPRALSRIVKRLGLRHLKKRADKRELLKLFRDAVRAKDAEDDAKEADAREGIKRDAQGRRYIDVEILRPEGIRDEPLGLLPSIRSDVVEVCDLETRGLVVRRYLSDSEPDPIGGAPLDDREPLPPAPGEDDDSDLED